jgi:hypothetical protein
MKPAELIRKVQKEGKATFSYWNQMSEDYYKDVGSGICEGLGIDWLRRKFNGKRNFITDKKYQPENKDNWGWGKNNSSLPKLEKKQKRIHERYSHFRTKNDPLMRLNIDSEPDPWFDPVQRFAKEYNMNRKKEVFDWNELGFVKKKSGFENMRYFDLKSLIVSTDENFRETSKNAIKQYAKDILTAVKENKIFDYADNDEGKLVESEKSQDIFGIMFYFHGNGNHTTAYFRNISSVSKHEYFDPNAGEFIFNKKDDFCTFLGDWWESAYSKKHLIGAEYIYFFPVM